MHVGNLGIWIRKVGWGKIFKARKSSDLICVVLLGLPRLSSFNNRNLISHSSGVWKLKIKVSVGLTPSEASLLGLHMAAFLLCLHMVFLMCTCNPGVSLDVQITSSYKDSQIVLGPTLITSFSFNHLFKDLISKYSHILRPIWRLWLQHMNFGKT